MPSLGRKCLELRKLQYIMSIVLVLEAEIGYTTRIGVAPFTSSNVLVLHILVARLQNMNVSCRKSLLIQIRHLSRV